MAHPVIEALYIGLFATGVAQPVDVPRTPTVEDAGQFECVSVATRPPRVVYDWVAGRRAVYHTAPVAVRPDAPQVGINEVQIQRMTRLAAS